MVERRGFYSRLQTQKQYEYVEEIEKDAMVRLVDD